VIGRITGDGNPFDAWGNGNYAINLPHAMSVVDKSERIAAIVYCADTSNEGHLGHPGRVLENVKILAEAAKSSRKPYYLMSSRPGLMNTQQAKAMRDAGLVQIGGTRQGLGAIDRVGRYMMGPRPGRARTQAQSGLSELLAVQPERRTINEFDSKRLLSTYGVPVTRERRVGTLADAKHAAREIGFPVVLKVVSDAIPHKTELGLVAVGLKNEDDLASAFTRLDERLGRVEPRPRDAAFLVQEMITDGVEVFAGISRDPDFGLTMAFGLGGTAIEVTRDFALRMLPLSDGDAEAMIAETRAAAMLGSVRGRPAADVKSLVACLHALSDFAHDNADRLAEVDLNPIKALPEGRGCVVVDALIVLK
jgi:acyl-CoA synthetase (NDP forming)